MRHVPLTRLMALSLGPILLLAACDRSADSPASPRTSEMVKLSQEPLDAVPYVPHANRPKPAVVETTEDETLTDETTSEVVAEVAETTPTPPVVVMPPTANQAPLVVPSRPEPAQPQARDAVQQN